MSTWFGAVLSSASLAIACGLIVLVSCDLWDALARRFLDAKFRRLRQLMVADELISLVTIFWLGFLVAIGVLLVDKPPIMLILFAMSIPAVMEYCDSWVKRRERKIRQQLLGAAYGMSNAASTGMPAPDMLRQVASETDAPLRPFFDRIISQVNGGVQFRTAIANVVRQIRLDEFTLFASCLSSNDQFGGEVSGAWTRIAQSLADFERLEEKIASDSASGRMAVRFMSMTPFWFGGLFYFIEPSSMAFLVDNLLGQIVLSFVILLVYIAYRWCQAIIDIKV